MRAFVRVLVIFLTTTAALAAVALSLLWVRSWYVYDSVTRVEIERTPTVGWGKRVGVMSGCGGLGVKWSYEYGEYINRPEKYCLPHQVIWEYSGLWTGTRAKNSYPLANLAYEPG